MDLDAKGVLSLENTHRRQELVAKLGALQNTSGSYRISLLRQSLNNATKRGNATERNKIKKQLQILLEAKGRNNKTIRERAANKFNKERTQNAQQQTNPNLTYTTMRSPVGLQTGQYMSYIPNQGYIYGNNASNAVLHLCTFKTPILN